MRWLILRDLCVFGVRFHWRCWGERNRCTNGMVTSGQNNFSRIGKMPTGGNVPESLVVSISLYSFVPVVSLYPTKQDECIF